MPENKRLKAAAAVILTALAAWILIAIRYDFYFDLNDDVLMKDILSGAYTGMPEGRNIQMLYPVSALIASLYRLSGAFPRIFAGKGGIYGVFLILCQLGSIGIITCTLAQAPSEKASGPAGRFSPSVLTAIAFFLLCAAAFMRGLTILQYTMAASFLCTAAAVTYFYEKRILSVILLGLAFTVRTEMALLLMPLFLVVCFLKTWHGYGADNTDERASGAAARDLLRRFRESFVSALIFLLIAVCLFAGLKAVDLAALSGSGWRKFTHLFDERTRLYDYYLAELPEYDDAPAFYDEIGVSRAQAGLLTSYNFGLDERIDDAFMEKTADAAMAVYKQTHSAGQELKKAFRSYYYRVTRLTDGAPAVITAILYLLVIVLGLRKYLFSAALLFACRSTLWIYLEYRRRVPERVTGGLYLMEMAALMLLLVSILTCGETDTGFRKRSARLYPLLLIILCAAFIYKNDAALKSEMASRDKVNARQTAYLEYCASHPGQFFFTDVYSTVAYSEKIFEKTASSAIKDRARAGVPDNHDIMGGWASKSPLYYKKLAAYGFASMEDALIHDEKAYLAAAPDRDLDWLTDYYAEKGIAISVRECDKIEDAYVIYQITGEDTGR